VAKKAKKKKPTLLNQQTKPSAATAMYPHLKSALAMAGPVGAVLSAGLKKGQPRGRGR